MAPQKSVNEPLGDESTDSLNMYSRESIGYLACFFNEILLMFWYMKSFTLTPIV